MMRKLLIAWALLVTTCIVIPFDQLVTAWRRWVCRRMNHRWVCDTAGEPVVNARYVCSRCGKLDTLPLTKFGEKVFAHHGLPR